MMIYLGNFLLFRFYNTEAKIMEENYRISENKTLIFISYRHKNDSK